ncbi:MAG: hypothetical protein IPG11_12385 [Flavobacteriales bacterium]|nr:hypothetical protein [Flavobacteriales bacterium]
MEYLPPDTAVNAQRLVALIRPKAAIFIKYEFWFHHLSALKKAHVPTFLVSAIFRPSQPLLSLVRWWTPGLVTLLHPPLRAGRSLAEVARQHRHRAGECEWGYPLRSGEGGGGYQQFVAYRGSIQEGHLLPGPRCWQYVACGRCVHCEGFANIRTAHSDIDRAA